VVEIETGTADLTVVTVESFLCRFLEPGDVALAFMLIEIAADIAVSLKHPLEVSTG
jgi:hypothetical protein